MEMVIEERRNINGIIVASTIFYRLVSGVGNGDSNLPSVHLLSTTQTICASIILQLNGDGD